MIDTSTHATSAARGSRPLAVDTMTTVFGLHGPRKSCSATGHLDDSKPAVQLLADLDVT